MHIIIDASGSPRLDQPSDFAAFSVKTSDPARESVLAALGHDGSGAPEADHVFVAVEAVRRWALAAEAGPAWEDGFARMLAYAATKGWMDSSGGSIKAHVEAL